MFLKFSELINIRSNTLLHIFKLLICDTYSHCIALKNTYIFKIKHLLTHRKLLFAIDHIVNDLENISYSSRGAQLQ